MSQPMTNTETSVAELVKRARDHVQAQIMVRRQFGDKAIEKPEIAEGMLLDAVGRLEALTAQQGEPVAWRWRYKDREDEWHCWTSPHPDWNGDLIIDPLYLRPAPDAGMREALKLARPLVEAMREQGGVSGETENEVRRALAAIDAALASAPQPAASEATGKAEPVELETTLEERRQFVVNMAIVEYATEERRNELLRTAAKMERDIVALLARHPPSDEAQRLREQAIEECARWHDERARDTPDAFEMELHQVSAKALRALASSPAEGKGDGAAEAKFMRTPMLVVGEDGVFSGYACIFGKTDLGRDVVERGAFRDALKRRSASGVRMLFQHDPHDVIGGWTEIREDSTGLYVKGRLTDETQRGREIITLMRAGALDGLSIGYRTLRAKTDTKSGVRRLLEVDLWEVSVVTFPMQPEARVFAPAPSTEVKP